MLVMSRKSRAGIETALARQFSCENVIRRVLLRGAKPLVETQTWRDYWEPCYRLAKRNSGLVHRLNRLKAAWRRALTIGASRRALSEYCWRYFGLIHHARLAALKEDQLEEGAEVLRRVVGFESFPIEALEDDSCAAAVVCHRNPVFLLGRLPYVVLRAAPSSPSLGHASWPRCAVLLLPTVRR